MVMKYLLLAMSLLLTTPLAQAADPPLAHLIHHVSAPRIHNVLSTLTAVLSRCWLNRVSGHICQA